MGRPKVIDLNKYELSSVIEEFVKEAKEPVSYMDIVKYVQKYSDYTDGQIAGKVRDLKKQNIIYNISYGKYAYQNKTTLDFLIDELEELEVKIKNREFREDILKNSRKDYILYSDIVAKLSDINELINEYYTDVALSKNHFEKHKEEDFDDDGLLDEDEDEL